MLFPPNIQVLCRLSDVYFIVDFVSDLVDVSHFVTIRNPILLFININYFLLFTHLIIVIFKNNMFFDLYQWRNVYTLPCNTPSVN